MNKTRVAVIFGGRSGEHEVSLLSAASVIEAINKDKYEVIPIGITKQGQWLTSNDALQVLQNGTGEAIPTGLLGDPTKNKLVTFDAKTNEISDLGNIDVIFPVLHGTFGEDGTIQGLFELANIPYVGAGVLASSAGMDKAIMKALFAQKGLPQCKFLAFLRKEWETDPANISHQIASELGFPCFVKPANLGSSVGISKATNLEELKSAMNNAAKYDRKIIIEEFIDGREIEVAVLGNDEPVASVPGEIVFSNDYYDYNAKYADGKSQMRIPADIPYDIANKVRQYAVEAFKAIDSSGLSRADFFITKSTGQIYINEINTLPGFTKFSMYPKMWEATGIPYDKLIDKLIELAMERHADKNRNLTSV